MPFVSPGNKAECVGWWQEQAASSRAAGNGGLELGRDGDAMPAGSYLQPQGQ